MALIDTSIVDPSRFQLAPQTGDITQRLLGVLQQKRQETQRQDIAQANKLKEDFKLVGDQMLRVRGISEFTTQRKEMARLAQDAIKRNEDPTVFTEALNIDNPDELNLYLTRVATQAGNVKDVIEQRTREAGGDQFESVKDEKGNIIAQRNIATGELIAAPKAITRKAAGEAAAKVKATEFLPGGGVRVIRDDGTAEVVQPTPEEVEFIRSAEERGVDIQQRRAKGRVLGAVTGKAASKAFDTTEKLRANNIKLKKVIAEVRDGAETGPISKRLPSFRASTMRLIALKNELGLDVISSVTFGALSERELETAMDTALPTQLQGPDLVKWAQEKISAQEKLAEYLEDQALFLSKRGNDVAKWIEHTRTQGKRPEGITEELTPQIATQQQVVPQPTSQSVGRFTIEVVE